MNNNNQISAKILSPMEFSGSLYGDYGFEINGKKSDNSYASKQGAKRAMEREINKIFNAEE
jgi:hypothetical protein